MDISAELAAIGISSTSIKALVVTQLSFLWSTFVDLWPIWTGILVVAGLAFTLWYKAKRAVTAHK